MSGKTLNEYRKELKDKLKKEIVLYQKVKVVNDFSMYLSRNEISLIFQLYVGMKLLYPISFKCE